MLFSTYIRFIFFIGLTGVLSISNPILKANNHVTSLVDSTTPHYHIAQGYIDATQKQLETLCNILSDISFLVHDNQVKTGTNKVKILENIQDLMQDLENKKNILKITTDIQVIHSMVTYTKEALSHVRTAVDTGCTTFDPFDTEGCITRNIPNMKQINRDQIKKNIHTNTQILKELELAAHSIGLHWYNKAYRFIDRYLLNYAQEYGLLSTGIILGSGYVFWHLFPELFEDTCLGAPYIPRPCDGTAHNACKQHQHLKIPGKIEQFLASFGLNLLPIGALLTYIVKESATTHWKAKTDPWLRKSIATIHYKMLGGSYIGKISKLDGIGKKILFSDLIGLEHAKHECQYLIEYMQDPETYIRRGQRINHILFTGPPRTGKTELAKALFYEVKSLHSEQVKFIPLPAASINVIGIDRCLDIIKYHAPCIVFIDEIDLLNVQRSGKNEVLSALLQGMSGLDNDSDPTKQVIIIGATNKPEYLDFALMTHGRFGKVIHFEYPNLHERTQFFTRQLEKLGLNITKFNVKKLARESEGKSYESLKTLIDHATLKARLAGRSLAYHHLEAALDEELYRIVPTNLKEIPEHEQEILAAHFSGHALALQLLDSHTKLSKVTIKPVIAKLKEELIGKDLWQGALGKKIQPSKTQARYIYGHTFTHNDLDTCELHDKNERIKLCKIYLAGIAAEKILLGSCGYSCDCHDKEKALEIIRPIIFEGLDPETLPKKLVTAKYQETMHLLSEYEREISELLIAHKDALINIALELKDSKTLDHEMIGEIVHDTESE
jgi:AAA+ superfamily predicted ATPase